jgi:hypothetical protein
MCEPGSGAPVTPKHSISDLRNVGGELIERDIRELTFLYDELV